MKEILCITTYPPRACGIATFSYDLIQNIYEKFGQNFTVKVCAVESATEKHVYDSTVEYTLNVSEQKNFAIVAKKINQNTDIKLICIQHEFGLYNENKELFLKFVQTITKTVVIVFHTVLSNPERDSKIYLQKIINACQSVVVMTHTSSNILQKEYEINVDKITIIPHGTHLIAQVDKKSLKKKYGFSGMKILSTFGLLSPGKSIETTLDALPAIIEKNTLVLFLIIGETHPMIVKTYGEAYRKSLNAKIIKLNLTDHVRFVNHFLDLPVLLEYLQMTDIYVFTSSDRNQAVSGTFVYALSCGCPIISTPIPHALELLHDNSRVIFDFCNSIQLAKAANRLLKNEKLRAKMEIDGLQKTAFSAWENSAIAYTLLFEKYITFDEPIIYSLPPINTEHIKYMSRHFGIIQFAKGNKPDIDSGYTLDDNARALIAFCKVYNEQKDSTCRKYIKRYLKFILFCAQDDGSFKNYVDRFYEFTSQNDTVLLEDSNGRTIWALGYFISHGDSFTQSLVLAATKVLRLAFPILYDIQSPRSLAFTIKGLSYFYTKDPSQEVYDLIKTIADKLVDLYLATTDKCWMWFETYLTYENAILPECLMYAYKVIKDERYKNVAKESFDFLLQKIFFNGQIKVISNQEWLYKGQSSIKYGEQPVDVAGTVMALSTFYRFFNEPDYLKKQKDAFNWFLGNNHLHQIVYNPATGGCYDGLEENNINLNQGAESSVCYLMSRLSLIKESR